MNRAQTSQQSAARSRPDARPPSGRRAGGSVRAAVLGLQRSVGNRATTRFLQRNGRGPVVDSLRQPYKKWDQKRSTRGHGGERKARWLRDYETKLEAVTRFMDDVVAPWATQARIAELINTNFEEMKTDPNLSSEPKFLTPADKRKPESTDPQIAPGDVSFIAPSRTATTAIHRGIVGIEMVDDEPYVRVYSALWAEARPDTEGKIVYKDIHQDPLTGAISVHTGRDQGEKKESSPDADEEEKKHPIMWLSAEPLRQLKWFYKYPIEKYNPGAKPVVRSFLIPLDLWTEISLQAVSEDEVKKPENLEKPFNVDTAYGSNQFGVRGPLLEEVRRQAHEGSLVSYVGDMSHSKSQYGGKVRHINTLHKEMGAPKTAPPTAIWIDPGLGKFVRTKKQAGIADELSFYHGVWTDNDEFLPDKTRLIPKDRRHKMFREFLAKNGLELPEGYTLR